MSLETALAENTAAVKDLISITKDLMSLRGDAVEKVTAAMKGDKSAKSKDEPKQNISSSPEDRKDPANPDPREGLRELIADYVKGTDREEERAARKDKVKKLLNHEKIKKADVSDAKGADDIMDGSVELFRDQVKKLIAKGDVTTPPEKKSDDLDDI